VVVAVWRRGDLDALCTSLAIKVKEVTHESRCAEGCATSSVSPERESISETMSSGRWPGVWLGSLVVECGGRA
jgi:hypothetical protein